MSKKLKHSKSLSPEELMLRTVRARRRFKALVRKVIANLPWLQDDEDDYAPKSVKKYMQTLTRKKPAKGLLSLQEKSILCKPAEDRSEAEKLFLYRIIGGLKCFRKYPENVKMQLAGLTYFVFFPAGRVIVRQNQEAHALFFIISGEVAVSIISIDPIFKEEITISVGTMVVGSMFGEVSLLHDIPRTATITTITPCELLCLKKADFDIVLKASVSQEWAEIQKSMKRFEYFKGWDEISVRECCLYSKRKTYARDQVILGEGFGTPSSCYFILKGRCRIIEYLLVEVTYDKNGGKRYKLFDSSHNLAKENVILDEKKDSIDTLYKLTKSSPSLTNVAQSEVDNTNRKSQRVSRLTAEKRNASSENRPSRMSRKEKSVQTSIQQIASIPLVKTNSATSKRNSLPPNTETPSVQRVSRLTAEKSDASAENRPSRMSRKEKSIQTSKQQIASIPLVKTNSVTSKRNSLPPNTDTPSVQRVSRLTAEKSNASAENRPSRMSRKEKSVQTSKQQIASVPLVKTNSVTPKRNSLPPNIETEFVQRVSRLTAEKSNASAENQPSRMSRKEKSVQTSKEQIASVPMVKTHSVTSKTNSLPPNIETHFMQVCILSETACFAIGENFDRRNVVAMSDDVECLVIPRYWLLQRNKGNIWTRIKQYLDQKIPSTKQVFHEFVEQRKWNNYKKKLFCDLFGKPPQNAYYNVPYSIRINEDIK